MKKNVNWFGFGFLISLLGLSGVLWAANSIKLEQALSKPSTRTLQALNEEYGIAVVDDLLANGDSAVMQNLLMANVLTAPENYDPTAKGLLATLGDESGVLLLQPSKTYSDSDLEGIAKVYMQNIPEFEYVELDQMLTLTGYPVYTIAGNLETDVELTAEESVEEDIVKVGVVDSGIDVTHEIFADVQILPGLNTFNANSPAIDDVGHGTHVAGIVAKNSENIAIAPYKIVNEYGGRLSNVVKGLDQAVEDGMDVINTSFGLLSPSYTLEQMVERIYDEGIILVSAAGNNASDSGFYPATYDHSIAVASVDKNNVKLPKSNYGEWVQFAAYGFFVYSSLPEDRYGVKSGTSQAAPLVTARVTRILQEAGQRDFNLDEVMEALRRAGTLINEGPLAGVTLVE